jgi:hypothetical protein
MNSQNKIIYLKPLSNLSNLVNLAALDINLRLNNMFYLQLWIDKTILFLLIPLKNLFLSLMLEIQTRFKVYLKNYLIILKLVWI